MSNTKEFFFIIKPKLAEDVVWRDYVEQFISPLPDNAIVIWNYAFTEMFNNAIDHSDGTCIWIRITKFDDKTQISIGDDGEGIFYHIKRVIGLKEPLQSILELNKGKLTTDPKNHSGEGIFFTSRIVDRFVILSRGLAFLHDDSEKEDWLVEAKRINGTVVIMELSNASQRKLVDVFNQFTSNDGDFNFDKTIISVKLVAEDDTRLISRSQAKRLLARIDRFKTVILDLKDVEVIGQGFADQVFRVFALAHPDIEIGVINASDNVMRMIGRAQQSARYEQN